MSSVATCGNAKDSVLSTPPLTEAGGDDRRQQSRTHLYGGGRACPPRLRLPGDTVAPTWTYFGHSDLFGGLDDFLRSNHVYRADVSPSGRMVQIVIHEKLALGRAGDATYAVDFKEEGAYTVVRTFNRKMPQALAAKMQYDIDRWKRGETNCSKVMPKVAAAAPAAQ